MEYLWQERENYPNQNEYNQKPNIEQVVPAIVINPKDHDYVSQSRIRKVKLLIWVKSSDISNWVDQVHQVNQNQISWW